MAQQGLTEQQEKWFASVRANLEKNTGRSLAEWLEIAKTAPEGTFRQRVQWFKAEHGLLQNSASLVLSELAGDRVWEDPAAHRAALWKDPAARAVFEAIEAKVDALGEVVGGQRKGYSAWSRRHQFAAARPAKGGVRLGLAVAPDADPRLIPAKSEGWSERLKATLVLGGAAEVDDGVGALLKAAWTRS